MNGVLLVSLAKMYALHPDRVLSNGLPTVLCWPTLRHMPDHHLWYLITATYAAVNDVGIQEDEYHFLLAALDWYREACNSYESHADHTHTVVPTSRRLAHG